MFGNNQTPAMVYGYRTIYGSEDNIVYTTREGALRAAAADMTVLSGKLYTFEDVVNQNLVQIREIMVART